MDELLAVLARERDALERLLFRLVETRALLARADDRFLHLAAHDVETAADAVRELELFRAIVDPNGDGAPLRSLAAQAEPPLSTIFEDLRLQLGRLAGEIGAVLEALADLAEDGRTRARGDGNDELDQEILAAGYEAILNARERLQLPSLVALLG